jgi:tetrahydromethanopterin S-methyltransferase subunit A
MRKLKKIGLFFILRVFMDPEKWPVETGRYQLGNKKSCVAVCTLSSLDIELPMDNIAIAGKCVTENIGMEKIIRNIISNPNIRYLVLCGVEPKGHYVGQAFKCLREEGLDENKKIIGARGAMPFIKNLNKEQLDHFKKQVEIVDMIEEEDAGKIMERIKELNSNNPGAFSDGIVKLEEVETIVAAYDVEKEATADSDLADSFFTILVDKDKKQIVVEHYKERKLNKRIVGNRAEVIAGTLVRLGLIKGLYHATYLGKELEKAEIALKTGRDYEQEKELKF